MGGNSDATWHFCPQITQSKPLGNQIPACPGRTFKIGQRANGSAVGSEPGSSTPSAAPPGCRLPVQMQDWSPPHTCTGASLSVYAQTGPADRCILDCLLLFGLLSAQYFESLISSASLASAPSLSPVIAGFQTF